MKTNFNTALGHVLVHEGGWADHPRDPGGATMKGVTLITFQRHFGTDKTRQDLKNISKEQLARVYESGYWNKCQCNDLPTGIDYAVFDAAVNSGPGRGAKWLQSSVGALQDGHIGPDTLFRVKAHDPVQVIDVMCDVRLDFLRGLSTWADFGKGWRRRVEGVRTAAVTMTETMHPGAGTRLPSIEYITVQKGSDGPWVKKLQTALKIHVDGIFGNDTDLALKHWQQENGLEPDGIAGRNTYRALGLIACPQIKSHHA